MDEYPDRKSLSEENQVGMRWRARRIVITGISGYIYLFGIRHRYRHW